MWPFKKKEPVACVNCKFCEAYKNHYNGTNYRCKRTTKERKTCDMVTGETKVVQFTIEQCKYEREVPWFNFWKCGRKGRFFKDNRKYT